MRSSRVPIPVWKRRPSITATDWPWTLKSASELLFSMVVLEVWDSNPAHSWLTATRYRPDSSPPMFPLAHIRATSLPEGCEYHLVLISLEPRLDFHTSHSYIMEPQSYGYHISNFYLSTLVHYPSSGTASMCSFRRVMRALSSAPSFYFLQLFFAFTASCLLHKPAISITLGFRTTIMIGV